MNTIKAKAQLYVGERPAIFYKFYRLKRQFASKTEARGRRVVQPTTQLVIEGFPRSANTFAVWAFRQAQPEDVRVAHHFHYPAQVVRAAQWQIPTLVLIREPREAVTSLIMRDASASLEQALRHYVSFYKTVTHYRDACVLGLFEEVIGDYGAVIEQVNSRFGTHFAVFNHTEENVGKVFSRIEERHRARNEGTIVETRIARPSSAKQEARRRVKRELEAPSLRKVLAEATAVYEDLTHQSTSRDLRAAKIG
jgi:hypothetical protein